MSRPRKHRSAEEWARLIAEYRAGSEGDAEFCKRRFLSLHTFRKYKYGQRGRRDLARSGGTAFTEVRVTPPDGGSHITVCGLDGVRVEVPVSLGINAVAELAKALGHGR